MKRQILVVAFLLIFSKNCECRFQDSYSKWSMDKDCDDEFCFVGDDCKYDIMNMILSITRWYIWKHRCSIKYGEGNKSNLHLKDELKIFIKSHINMMLQLNKIKNTKMIMLCNDIANML